MDFLLLVIRRLFTTSSKRPKIILMSATIDTYEVGFYFIFNFIAFYNLIFCLKFSNYFKIRREPAPVLKVSSRRVFEVKEYYLCDMMSIITSVRNLNFVILTSAIIYYLFLFPFIQDLEVDYAKPDITSEVYRLALKLFVVFDNIDKKEVEISPNKSDDTHIKNSVLVFLPGIHEIDRMSRAA